MVKKIISVATAFLMLCCMVPFYAFAESATCPKCGKDTLITNQDISVEIGEEVGLPLSLKRAYCSTCHYAKYEYNVLGVAGEQAYDDGDESHIINFLKSLKEQLLGKNSTATKFTPGGGSTSGGGVGRPKGYDDNGSALVSNDGMQRVRATFKFFLNYDSDKQPIESFTIGNSSFYAVGTPGQVILTSENTSNVVQFSGGYFPVQQLPGYYTLPAGTEVYNFNYYQGNTHYPQTPTITSNLSGYGRARNYKNFYISSTETNVYFFYVNDISHENEYSVSLSNTAGSSRTYTFKGSGSGRKILIAPHDIYLDYTPDTPSTNLRPYTQYNITNNNITNKWNGNIYVDNSNNLTYIYPRYITVNEKNETVTNISNTPIIYNNETKKYYTYDNVTNNYYYISYEPQATPAPSPSPTPAPTEKPGGSVSTPETGKPGGDTGDTTGILAVLVEIRDNMIRGFLDIKAAFVAGFAELSANFTLAIENLNVNIQNIFNKKFPDQSTPETALPSPTPSPSPAPTDPPSPSPAPTDPPSPSPAPDPGNPDSGDKTNNFWTIIFPNGGGSEDGKKGIFWALVSLILALIAFFANLAVGVGYLFPFLPDGVVMTINTCLIVIFLFTIIKFIMRSK